MNNYLREYAADFKSPDYILSYTSILPLLGNIVAAFFCLGCSATFHLLSVKSVYLNKILARLDYGGISFLILGTVYAILHYSFACDEVFIPYIAFTSVMIFGTALCFFVTLVPSCDTPKFRPVRAGMFIGVGLSTISVFVYIGCWQNEYQLIFDFVLCGLGGGIYILGAVLYALRVPEKCKPGCFDFCGASHQIFHFCVLIGSFLHYTNSHILF